MTVTPLQKREETNWKIFFSWKCLRHFVERKVCNFADKTWHLRNFHFIFWCFLGEGIKMKNLKSLHGFYFKKNFMASFIDDVQLSQGYRTTPRRQFTLYPSVPRSSWYSFNRPRKDEKLSWPRNHPVVLNLGTLDLESSTLTTRPFPNNHF